MDETFPALPPDYKRISGRFSYSTIGAHDMTFIWDGAAIGPNGDLVLIEEELTAPVHVHIQGHVARAAFMVAAGERVSKLVWVVPARHFHALWSLVEPWRTALSKRLRVVSPHCEYWEPGGNCLGVSPDFK